MPLRDIAARMRTCDSAHYHFPDGLSVQWQRDGDNVALILERLVIMPGDMDVAQMREAFDVPDDVAVHARTVAHPSKLKPKFSHRWGQIRLAWIERQPVINR